MQLAKLAQRHLVRFILVIEHKHECRLVHLVTMQDWSQSLLELFKREPLILACEY